MARRTTRRSFLQTSTAAAAGGYFIANSYEPVYGRSANERIRFASVGIGGKGSSDSGDAAKNGDMVAICDVDRTRLGQGGKRFEKAEAFTDFRQMFDKMGSSIDAVTVSTPDHTHAAPSLMAMRMGKHCFTQKPMTHSIYEARLMAQVAAEKKVATMMGNQGTAEAGLRRAAALIKQGYLGTVTAVHVWTNRPIWPQGGDRPAEKPAPDNVDWDSFIGPAKMRPYGDGYHPFAWRGWWDFGTGALGDMACHTLNMPFAGLDLRDPTSVQATTSGHNGDSYPKWSEIVCEFPERNGRPAVKLYWYDGGKKPNKEVIGGKEATGSGCAVVGSKHTLFSPNDYGAQFEVLGVANGDLPKVDFEASPGHFDEWVRAINGGKAAMSNFVDYAGPLTETVLLGNLAVWVAKDAGSPGQRVEWDAKALKVKNVAGLEEFVKPNYRAGYTLDA
jgi:predicted dehydrogenase